MTEVTQNPVLRLRAKCVDSVTLNSVVFSAWKPPPALTFKCFPSCWHTTVYFTFKRSHKTIQPSKQTWLFSRVLGLIWINQPKNKKSVNKNMCHRSLLLTKGSPFTCVPRSSEFSGIFSPCQGAFEESAQREFKEVSKWVWNVSFSHAELRNTPAEHLCWYLTVVYLQVHNGLHIMTTNAAQPSIETFCQVSIDVISATEESVYRRKKVFLFIYLP